MAGRNDPCWCGSGKKWKKCHYPSPDPQANSDFGRLKRQYLRDYDILIKNEEQIAGIRRAAHLTAEILEKTCRMAKAGVTTAELDAYAHELHREAGARPAPLNYGHPPFPKSICTSLNEVICHGIPDDRPLQDGDILNIDCSLSIGGYFGDCSQMVQVGEVSAERKHVCDVSYHSLMRSLEVVKPGGLVSDIGAVIEEYATGRGCSVVTQFVAHGIGLQFHEGPQIPHHKNGLDIELIPGMTFTIEPMINAGVSEAVVDEADSWTARTLDGKASAQWEHQLLVTEEGCEILTPWEVVSGSY